MSENENVGIELGVDADAVLETFQQLATAARAADTDIQALKEQLNTLTSRVTTGATTPEIAQTRQALNARRAEVQGQALDFVGTHPQVATQPLPDTLAQFQDAMAQREQQQQAQQQRQAQQQAAGIERPARYGYDTTSIPAPLPSIPSAPIPAPLPGGHAATGVPVSPVAPVADSLTQALTAQTPPSATPAGAGADGVAVTATTALTDDIQALAAAAIAADPALRQLQQRLQEQVNQTFSAQGLHATTYEQAAGFVARMEPAGLAGAAPDIAQTTDALAARRVEVTGQVRDFAAATPDATAQPLSTQQGPKVAKAEISAKYHHVRRRDPTVSVAAYLIGTSHTD